MIYIALSAIFNGFILGLIFQMGGELMHVKSITGGDWFLVGYAISALLAFVGYTKLAGQIVGLFISGRQPIGREIRQIEPIVREVIQKVNEDYHTDYKFEKMLLRVSDDKVPNAFALSYNMININRGSLETFTDSQLKAILAHEIGHLYYRDSVRSIALIFSAFATKIIMWIYAVYAAIVAAFGVGASAERSGSLTIVALAGYVIMFLFIPVIVLNWIGDKLFFLLYMAMSRKAEYRADAFAASLGYKSGMVEALEVLSNFSISDNSFLGKLNSTHPATMLRIGALEDNEIQKQYFGIFKAGVAFHDAKTGTKNFKELAVLSSYLVFIGVAFGAYGYFNMLKARSNISDVNVPSQVAQPISTVSSHKKAHKHNVIQRIDNTVKSDASKVSAEVKKIIHKKPKNKPAPAANTATANQSDAPAVDNMVHIVSTYKVSDNRYTVTYTYHGEQSVAITKFLPSGSTITKDQLDSLK